MGPNRIDMIMESYPANSGVCGHFKNMQNITDDSVQYAIAA